MNIQNLIEGVVRLTEIATIGGASRVSFDPSERYQDNRFVTFIRLGGSDVLIDNVYCGKMRHNIVIDIYNPTSARGGIGSVFGLKQDIESHFSEWGGLIDKASNTDGEAFEKGRDCQRDQIQGRMVDKDECTITTTLKEAQEALEDIIKSAEATNTYELASSYLTNGGTYSLQGYNGVGLELSFQVDENVRRE